MLNSLTAKSAIDHALFLGADFAELYIENQQVNSINLSSQEIEKVSSGIDFGIGIRLFFGNNVLYGYTNDTKEEELKRIIELLSAKNKREQLVSAAPMNFIQLPNRHPIYKPLSQNSYLDDKVDFLRAVDFAARAESDKVTQFLGQILQKQQKIEIYNSEGLHVEDVRHYTRFSGSVVAVDGNQQSRGEKSPGALAGWELSDKLNPQQLGQDIAHQALVKLGAQPCPSGNLPVVIGNGFGGVIFHEACGHLLETTSVAKKASVFYDKMNHLIANPKVNAFDDGTLVNAWGSTHIDDEGMETKRTQLIKDGVLTNFMVDKLGSQKTGYEKTGSGRRENYTFAPTSRMRNTFIDAGEDEFDSMIASIDYGIYAKEMGGGSVQPGTGEFNFSVKEPYLIENGKITKPLKGATLIGTGPDVLKEISMVGKDLTLAAGMCGSVSGSIPTTVGQPTLKVDNILVGGGN